MLADIDSIRLHFDRTTLLLLNIILGFVMYGVALDIRPEDFRRIVREPIPVVIGLIAQFVLFPAVSFGLVLLLDPHPGIALGMLLVACCPGGNISNFITQLARGNVALSVTLTAASTVGATFLLPLNFTLWTALWVVCRPDLHFEFHRLQLQAVDMFGTVLVLLALPLLAGVLATHRWPGVAARLRKPLRVVSLLFLIAFIGGALYANRTFFLDYIDRIAGLVLLHNGAALLVGYLAARASGMDEANRRAIMFETGIQNYGLALVLIFDFFEGRGALALIAAWWGVWHIVSGLSLATAFAYRDRNKIRR